MTTDQLEEWLAGYLADADRCSSEESDRLERALRSHTPPRLRGPSRTEAIRQAKLHEEIMLGIKWRDAGEQEQRAADVLWKARIQAEEYERARQAASVALVAAKLQADGSSPSVKGAPKASKGRNLMRTLKELEAEGFRAVKTPQEVRDEVRKRHSAAGLAVADEEDALRKAIDRAWPKTQNRKR